MRASRSQQSAGGHPLLHLPHAFGVPKLKMGEENTPGFLSMPKMGEEKHRSM
jgi:hypothetical protein